MTRDPLRTEGTGDAMSAGGATDASFAPPPIAESNESGRWDPIQVPLPTYIGKAMATRTVRTVDLGEPGAWTSGRLPEAELLARPDESATMLLDETEPESPARRAEPEAESPGEQRKAVGD